MYFFFSFSFLLFFYFFFNDTATTEIYTLSLHDALPIIAAAEFRVRCPECDSILYVQERALGRKIGRAPSELQSHVKLVCRLLLEKKNSLETATIQRVRNSSLIKWSGADNVTGLKHGTEATDSF